MGGRQGAGAVIAALALLAASAAVTGCGLGEGERSEGEATLTVTRDYGAESLLEAAVEDPPATENVMRLLDGEAEVETAYGGGFVQSIDGHAGDTDGARRTDWFFYVNGVESPVGAAEVDVEAGDRIWWDLHDWTDVMRVPAVVGSYPAPFATGGGEVTCAQGEDSCAEVEAAIGEAAGDAEAGSDAPQVLVGPWDELAERKPASGLSGSPARTGVFARFEESDGGTELVLYDETLAESDRLGPGAGLVAAIEGPDAPVWVVTGTDADGVAAAASLLDEDGLADNFAVATSGDGEPVPIPVRSP
jgi:hypothetical protein